ncbi:MAG: ATPase, T2SS/T4P/T4SS family [Candidatus Diapherotrites archaeon]
MPSYLDDLIKKAKKAKEEELEEEKTKGRPKKELSYEELKKKIIIEKPAREKPERIEEEEKEERKGKEVREERERKEKEKQSRKERIERREEEEELSFVEAELEQSKKELIDSYGEVKIYRVPEKELLYYIIPVSKPALGERTIISTIKEAATRIISIAPYKIRDPEQRRTVYKQKIIEILQSSQELNIPERRFDFYAEAVVREMVGYGMIDPLVRDDKLEEIMVIGSKKPVYVFHRKYEMMVTNIEFLSDNEIIDLINRIAREVGRRVDISAPLLDARLADGSRVNATIPPASISGASLTIRKFREDPYSVVDLINYNTMDVPAAAFLWLCVDGLGVKPANILITGGTGSGKTTTLNVLASFIPERERIVTIEDSVDGEEEIIVFKDNKPRKIRIGELIDKKIEENGCSYSFAGHERSFNFEGIETICFDENGKIKKAAIDSFVRHKTNKNMYEIVFRSGKKIKVTQDHSLFSLNEEAKIAPIKTSSLKQGSFVAAPRKLFDCEPIKEINLLEHMGKLEKCFVVGQSLQEKIKKIGFLELEKYSKGTTGKGRKCSVSQWKKKGIIKIELFKKLCEKGLIDLNDTKEIFIKSKVNSRKIPAAMKIDEVFLEFIGLWIADGCYDKNSIIISANEKEIEQVIKEIAERFSTEPKIHSDKFSFMINSSTLKKIMAEVLGLKGNSFTKKIPDWMHALSNQQTSCLLRGYFSGDGTIGKNEIEWTSCSEQLMKDIQIMLLRIGIMPRSATKRYLKDKSFKGRISSHSQILLFMEKIGFIQEEKNKRAFEIALKGKATHDSTDLIPLPMLFLQSKRHELKLQHEYYSGHSVMGRRFVQKIMSAHENKELEWLANSDIFWDQVKEVRLLPKKEIFVYDLSVPKYENFVCSNIFVHNTAELNLPLKHIISLEARPPGLEGTGEITLDVLTKNSLRMRPDRIIVGEVRHDEAFTLFTAMNTGHDGAIMENSLIQMADGSIQRIEELSQKYFGESEIKKEKGFEFVELKEKPSIIAVDKTDLKEKEALIERIWRRNIKTESVEIKMASGKEIKLSSDHPIFRIKDGFLEQVHCSECEKGDYIASINSICLRGEKQDEEMAYAVGLILGDGHLRGDRIEFVNNEIKLHKKFNEIIEKEFHARIKTSRKKNENTFRSLINSVELSRKLNSTYEIPFGNKTRIFNVPKIIEKSGNNVVSSFLRGLFDCEGSVSRHRSTIFFSTSNKNLRNKIPLLLSRFGIHSRINMQEKDGKGNWRPYYRITVSGQKNLEKFNEGIGFSHPKKTERLGRIIGKKDNTNVDVIPSAGKIIASIRKRLGVSQKELAKKCFGSKTRSTINAIECNKRMPSKSAVKKINSFFINKFNEKIKNENNNYLSETRKLMLHLNSVSSESIFWDKIKKIKGKESTKTFYDFTLSNYHTYIANGLMVSNCLGTIHANSPQETIVRITSPPMNVPEVMLSGLDLIIVEHRIHDRKKGTIRRFTEIAEVTGVLEGKTTTQSLYERDPVNDLLKQTNVQSEYLKTLMKFTGYTRKQLDQELKERESVLKRLVSKKIRALPEVAKEIQKFLLSRREN